MPTLRNKSPYPKTVRNPSKGGGMLLIPYVGGKFTNKDGEPCVEHPNAVVVQPRETVEVLDHQAKAMLGNPRGPWEEASKNPPKKPPKPSGA